MRSARRAGRDARQLWRLCLVDGALDETRARLVTDAVIDSRHTGKAAVLSSLLRLLKLDRARRTARIASAKPLDPDMRAGVERDLARRYGDRLATIFTVDPTLIGGMRLIVGSDVYDGSVKARLAALEAAL
jgi:F-type H+-transporting ATPase subunit delta